MGKSDPIADFEKFLARSKVDLGKASAARTRFIHAVMKKVRGLIGDSDRFIPVAPLPVEEPGTREDRVLKFKPKFPTGPGGAVVMTGGESIRADEKAGRSPFANRSTETNGR